MAQGEERRGSQEVSDAEQIGAYYLDAINPVNGTTFSLIVRYEKKEAIKKYGMGRTRELTDLVPRVVACPTAIFQGVRDRCERDWLCYVGRPPYAIELPTGGRIPPWPGKVFLVFANARHFVYNWYWSPADPDQPNLPENHNTRFYKQLL